ncbi:MAG TPA: hypothetical protein VJT49_30830 [Amycolatopsis sp.]|uniref:hypothetical protein n=1 Tax=Amycolatopsis sp. TaxID=37632 RepID=UPI002B4801CD|nr:hypothetical protein [Amycolatopsis sp.]HKS49428.1 hypothetical protein [Amycolatopsis sp.]
MALSRVPPLFSPVKRFQHAAALPIMVPGARSRAPSSAWIDAWSSAVPWNITTASRSAFSGYRRHARPARAAPAVFEIVSLFLPQELADRPILFRAVDPSQHEHAARRVRGTVGERLNAFV